MVIGCYKRAMDQLFRQVISMPQMPEISDHINLIEQSADEVAQRISAFCSNYRGPSAESHHITEDSGWPSWYPVIDRERCTHCGQCADFCLFGVFEKSDTHVKVTNPRRM